MDKIKELIKKILTKEVILYIAFGILTTIVNALPNMNLQNSIILSLKESASEWKTKSLLVIYANITANKIAIKFDMFSFHCNIEFIT